MKFIARIHPLQPLLNRRILVVEDEALIAFEVEESIKDAGGIVAGPFATVAEALEQVDRGNLSAALLDVQLAEQTSLAVARRLIPIDFTGQQIPVPDAHFSCIERQVEAARHLASCPSAA